jgi:hypothetical protein
MPCLVNVFRTFWGTSDQPNKNPGARFWCMADIFSHIAKCEIQQRCMLIARKISQVSLVGCKNDWHNCRSGRTLNLCIPPSIASVHLAVDSTTLRVSKAHGFKTEVRLKWEMCHKELHTFEKIPVE